MAQSGGKRRSKQAEPELVAALAAGASVKDAATRAGLTLRTAERRAADPEVRREVTAARSAMLGQAVGQLAEAATKATARLVALLDSPSETVALSAARAILSSAVALREHAELEERLAEVERLVTAGDGKGFGPRRLAGV